MIAFIEGEIIFLKADLAIIKTHGVGYKVYLGTNDSFTLAIGNKVSLHIHTQVKEDCFDLYGFLSPDKKELFTLLLSVSHVGPKLALAMVSALEMSELTNAIINKDIKTLSSISGVGKKTAERIGLELKDKISKLDITFEQKTITSDSIIDSLRLAINNLGYTKEQSEKAIKRLKQDDIDDLPLEELVKKSLHILVGAKSS